MSGQKKLAYRWNTASTQVVRMPGISSEHPLVFVTTEGPGYGGLLSGVTLPGLAIIDADTREVVTSQNYDVLSWGWSNVFEPHGLGYVAGWQWIYLPTGEGSFGSAGDHAGRFLVINARTLKIDKVIKLSGPGASRQVIRTHPKANSASSFTAGRNQCLYSIRMTTTASSGSVSHQEQGSEGYLYFASSNGDKIIGTGRYRRLRHAQAPDRQPGLD